MSSDSTPRTAAGRYMLDYLLNGAGGNFALDILAIEAEAAMNGYNLHVDQMKERYGTDEAKASWLMGFEAGKEQAAEAEAASPAASGDALHLLRAAQDYIDQFVSWEAAEADGFNAGAWSKAVDRALAASPPLPEGLDEHDYPSHDFINCRVCNGARARLASREGAE